VIEAEKIILQRDITEKQTPKQNHVSAVTLKKKRNE